MTKLARVDAPSDRSLTFDESRFIWASGKQVLVIVRFSNEGEQSRTPGDHGLANPIILQISGKTKARGLIAARLSLR